MPRIYDVWIDGCLASYQVMACCENDALAIAAEVIPFTDHIEYNSMCVSRYNALSAACR